MIKEAHMKGMTCPICTNPEIDFRTWGSIRYYVCKKCGYKWSEKVKQGRNT
jgi:transposase-like protein